MAALRTDIVLGVVAAVGLGAQSELIVQLAMIANGLGDADIWDRLAIVGYARAFVGPSKSFVEELVHCSPSQNSTFQTGFDSWLWPQNLT